jgi:hypothetical protein
MAPETSAKDAKTKAPPTSGLTFSPKIARSAALPDPSVSSDRKGSNEPMVASSATAPASISNRRR